MIAMGSIASEAISAAVALAAQGISCAVAVVATLNPAPVDSPAALVARFPLALAVEAHYIVGGVGSLVSKVIAERGLPCRVIRCGVRSTPEGVSGSQGYLYRVHGLSSDLLATTALKALREIER